MSTVKEALPRVPNGSWSVDRTHSRVEFEVEHLGFAGFRGGFREYDARLVVGLTGISVEGTARVDSVDVDDSDLETHLLSPDFFDAERHPEIRFRSTGYKLDDDGELGVTGELEIRGHARKVEARGKISEPSLDPAGNRRVAVRLRTEVDRHDFGLDWNAELPNGKPVLGDEVRLEVVLELVEEAG